MTNVFLALMFCILGGFESAVAADAPRQMPTVSSEVSSQPTYDDASARNAFSSGDQLYCERVTSGEHQLSECLRAQMEYGEHELNDTYKAAMAQLSPTRQNALKKEERGWIKWREATCARQVKDVEDCECGVPWTMRVACMTEEAQARTKHLKTQWKR